MTNNSAPALSDAALLAETVRVAEVERRSTSQLIALLAEMDTRRLYLGQGYPSMFAWCTQVLHLSEPSAYSRITAARAARRLPVIFRHLADGAVTLTTVSLLASHLTDENHEMLLSAARYKSKRDVERLVACLDPQPDVTASVRRLPVALDPRRDTPGVVVVDGTAADEAHDAPALPMTAVESPVPPVGRHFSSSCARPHPRATARSAPSLRSGRRGAVVAPLSADRYLLKVTLSQEAHAKLARIQDLLRHTVPNGDPAAIVDRALTVLLEHLENAKHAATGLARRQSSARSRRTTASRHVPATVKRAVWTRDEGRCAFVGEHGRCRATGFLEFHHVVPFARGGPTSVENLQLRCRPHNAYEAERELGAGAGVRPSRPGRTLSGQSWKKSRDLHGHVLLDRALDLATGSGSD